MMWHWMIAATFCIPMSWAEIFSATAHLQQLFEIERHMVTALHEYIDRTELKLSQVRRYLHHFYDSSDEKFSMSSDNTVFRPLQIFQLVRRISVEWDILETAMSSDDWLPVNKLTREYRQLMPNQDDLQGAALALVRLQDTYRLNMSDIARGDVMGMPQGTSLTARDLLYLGKQSFNSGYYAHAIRWLEEALSQALLEGNSTASYDEIRAFYESAVYEHDKLFERTDIDLEDIDTFGQPLRGDMSFSKPTTLKSLPLGTEITKDDDNNFMALCRGETLKSVSEESKLSCRLETRNSPYLLLQPVKVEERSLDPYLVQFHDLLTDTQTDLLRQFAEPKLAKSLVRTDDGFQRSSLIRTSQNAWLDPFSYPLVDRVYKLLEAITGLSTKVNSYHAEMMQIANYGIGGHYSPHYDYFFRSDTNGFKHLDRINDGDRTATLMFYLSDVTRGGATVFPRLGIGIWPKKGSAAFWYNMKRNGDANELTLHGACPVAHGVKWVSNIWFREIGQAFRRPCTLDPSM